MAVHTDRAFVRSFAVVIAGMAGIGIICAFIAVVLSAGVEQHPHVLQSLLVKRLAPVSQVITDPKALMKAAQAKAASQPKLSGEQVVAQVCSACHGTGMLGSPKIGDAAEWGKRFKTQGGLKGLVGHAIKGLNQMPPRGGDSALTDDEIHDAVKYMLSKAGISG